VISQQYADIEYIVIDGFSTDGTFDIVNRYLAHISHCVSEPDEGMYHALNKGISMATGELVGILNADDFLEDSQVVTELVRCVRENDCDAVYGNLHYVKRRDPNIISRKWVSKSAGLHDFERGWMPAHPTLFIKRIYFDLYGNYALNLGTAADYELILRFLYTHRLKAVFLNKLMVNMRTGGLSNGSFVKLYRAFWYDYKAMRLHDIPSPFMAITFKKIRKLRQFFWSSGRPKRI
jgi:glycosyltransferase